MTERLNDLESEIRLSQQKEEEAVIQNNELQEEVQNHLNQMDKFEMIKADLELQINEFV